MDGQSASAVVSHYSSKHKRKKHGSPIGTVIKLILLLLIVGGVVVFVVKFAPLMLSGKFNTRERFNLVLSSPEKISFVSVDAGSGKATIVNFPPDLYITNVAHGYGQYPIGKVYDLGQLDAKGGQVLSDTVAIYLGVPVDGYVRLPDFSTNDLKANFIKPSNLLNATSDVNLWDRILMAKALMGLRFDKVKTVDLAGKSEPLLLADGSSAKVFIEEDLDKVLEGIFVEEEILKESLRVQVVNTTGLAGLGNSLARVVSGLGATVIDVTSEEPALSGCKLEATDKIMKSTTVKRVAEIFQCEVVKNNEVGRADVIVYLGQEQGKIFSR